MTSIHKVVGKYSIRLLALTMLLFLTTNAQAEWVRATGQAMVEHGDKALALDRARDNALREAALKLRARVASEDVVENGVLTRSRLTVDSQAQARELRVVSERFEGGFALVTIEADMVEGGACAGSQAAGLQKRVAVAGFALADRSGAALGKLYGAERALADYFYQQLLTSESVEPFSMSQRQLYSSPRNTPTISEPDNRVHKSLAMARELDVQFVLSGVVHDLGPVDPEAWGTSVTDGLKRAIGYYDQRRRFVLDLVVHDGFSGSPVMEKRYQTIGRWGADREADVGFMTPAFRSTDYGREVAELLGQAAAQVAQELRCQPFMARITRVEDHQVYLAAGATSGLRPGQELSIYRRFEFIDSAENRYELQPTHTTLEINQVHPEFARGRIPVQAGRRNIQREDIAIVW